jgi:hypothetical protein
MSTFIKNSLNSIYNKISNIFYYETEEEKIQNFLNMFFKDYEEILDENKLIFNIYLYKINHKIEDNSINAGLNNYSKTFYNENINKSLYYLYKFSFGYENYKKTTDGLYVDIYLPDGMSQDRIIIKKYYYKISSIKNNVNNIIKDIKLYKDEPTFRSIITEIIDELKNI